MASVSKVGDVVILSDNESYFVVDIVEFEGNSYLKIGNTVAREVDKEPEYVSGFVKEVINNGVYSLALVTNPKLIDELNGIIKQYSSQRLGN